MSSAERRRIPRKPPGESGEFIWLVSLSDLMILLFVLFVVLFSTSYKKMKNADFAEITASLRNVPPPPNPIDEMKRQLSQWVIDQNLMDKVAVEKRDDAVLIQIKDKLLFGSGDFVLLPGGVTTIRTLEKVLSGVPEPFQIGIEGHTDDTPISTKKIEDNWDLSSKRAMAVMRTLRFTPSNHEASGPHGLWRNETPSPQSYYHRSPIPENQSKNRRVTLRIF